MSSSEEAMKQSIEGTFMEHHKEIQRRREIKEQGLEDEKTFTRVASSINFDFRSPDQKFTVFSLSQQKFAPIPENLSNPAVCIYGAFPTYEEALEYARDSVLSEHKQISVLADETHKWIVAVKHPENLMNETYVTQHRDKLLGNHMKRLHMNLKDFEENVQEKKTGRIVEEDDDDLVVVEPKHKGKSHKISNKLDVRGQKLAVVSFLKDDADVPEFLFQVYGFFEKEEDANAYIRNVCGDKVQDFDLDVVSTCEWIFPQSMSYDKANKEVFRSEELDNIMQTHKKQPQEVARFKETNEYKRFATDE